MVGAFWLLFFDCSCLLFFCLYASSVPLFPASHFRKTFWKEHRIFSKIVRSQISCLKVSSTKNLNIEWMIFLSYMKWSDYKQNGLLAPAHIFRPNANILIIICIQLKTRLLFKNSFSKVSYRHHFHHWFLYFLQKRGGGVSRLLVQIFRLTIPRNSLGNTSVFQKLSGIKNFYD